MDRNLFVSWIITKHQLFINTARKHLHGHLKNMAEDIAQDAIYIMLKKADKFNGTEKQFDSYANKTVISKCIDYSRSGHAKYNHEGVLINENEKDKALSQIDILVKLEERSVLRHALLRLDRRDMRLILLKVNFNCSARQIESRLNIREANVSQYYKRSISRLADIYNDLAEAS